jgi:hypothetical protein
LASAGAGLALIGGGLLPMLGLRPTLGFWGRGGPQVRRDAKGIFFKKMGIVKRVWWQKGCSRRGATVLTIFTLAFTLGLSVVVGAGLEAAGQKEKENTYSMRTRKVI